MPGITFVESRETFSVYRDRDGEEVLIANGPGFRRVIEFDMDVITEMWGEWKRQPSHIHNPWVGRENFTAHLRTRLTDPDLADDVIWCGSCSDIGDAEDCSTVTGGSKVCDTCLNGYYSWCEHCEEYCGSDDFTDTLADVAICGSCRRNDYSYCDDCDGYYPDGRSAEHEHQPEICCESPAQTFEVRNDGEGMLANDVRATITLPAGTIDSEGITRIIRYLSGKGMYSVADLVYGLGDKWQTREGNFTKRLSRTAYKVHQMKVPPEVISQIGCIAREHSASVDFQIEVTRDLNQSAADFAHGDSCWWQSYSEGRCALKTNGGFGLRTFDTYGDVSGRAWVMPLRNEDPYLTPTFDTVTADAFVVFNGYGALQGYNAARIISHMAGWTYRKVGFTCSPMYVNSDSGYVVAPEEIADRYTDGSLCLSVSQHSSLFRTEAARITEKELVNV